MNKRLKKYEMDAREEIRTPYDVLPKDSIYW